jgi:hypothetical protein
MDQKSVGMITETWKFVIRANQRPTILSDLPSMHIFSSKKDQCREILISLVAIAAYSIAKASHLFLSGPSLCLMIYL